MEATGHLDFWGRGGGRSADWEAIITYVIDGFMGMGSWGRTLTHCSCAEACFRSLQLLRGHLVGNAKNFACHISTLTRCRENFSDTH